MTWSPAKKITFRFFVAYLLLFSTIAHTNFFFDTWSFWDYMIEWFARNILSVKVGPRPYSYGYSFSGYLVLYTLFVTAAVLITTVWSVLDRRRKNYERFFGWFVIGVRYFLINEMMIYGFTKLFFVQFGEIQVAELDQPLGDLSPMGLVWVMMSYSKGYTLFSGILELLAGLFLLFRKTQTLGALTTAAVMLNVVALNFFYDISVKVFSSHLFVLALFLISLDARRLWNMLVLNKATEPKIHQPLFRFKQWNRVKNLVKGLVIAALILYYSISHLEYRNRIETYYTDTGIRGTYTVYFFNRKSTPELTLDDWKKVTIKYDNGAEIKCYSDMRLQYGVEVDSANRFVVLKNKLDRGTDTMAITALVDAYVGLKGKFRNDTLEVGLHKVSKDDFTLTR
ncbi:MAG: hypothetical protein HYZ14_19255 [Bacteroidetes bacterium]|nr:hypothetical protein [Bacteroidota bacterium]